ncbi:metallophosphoesterase [Radiobacillus sp. PE A8.2]|uniref:metallophosphoesterase n=1 Tax=Radiobacillus sp. PE A8.2 TaxID=3380349 RepID=UPI00388D84F8
MNRRSFLKKLLASTITFLGLGGGSFYYAREIEPTLLTIHEHTIKSTKIPKAFESFKIAQFSDTHLGFHYTLEQFTELVQTINDQDPDLVLFTGDLVDMPNKYDWDDKLIETLANITAPYGKYWIYGNHDHGGYGTDLVKRVMDQSNFQLLQNSNVQINIEENFFTLAGLDDVMLGRPDIESALAQTDENIFTMLLVHEPDYADITKSYPVDVQLSGHSHGGQIQVPLLGYLYTPPFAEKYVEGKYTIGTNPLELYVSRGIGTTRMPYRFLCRPEISFYTLKPTN